MDYITKGLIGGCLAFLALLAASAILGGAMEQRAFRPVDTTYSPAKEATVDAWGMLHTSPPVVDTGRAAHIGVGIKGQADGPS